MNFLFEDTSERTAEEQEELYEADGEGLVWRTYCF